MARRACPRLSKGCACERCAEQRAYKREWYRRNKDLARTRALRKLPGAREKAREYVMRRRADPDRRDEINARRRELYAKSPERYRRHAQNYRDNSPLLALATRLRFAERHPHYGILSAWRWQDAHPERYAAKRQRDRLLLKHYRGSRQVREELGRGPRNHRVARREIMAPCYLCGLAVILGAKNPRVRPSRDHVIPVSKGGAHDEDNLAVVHRSCNSAKRDRLFSPGDVPEWFSVRRRSRIRPLVEAELDAMREGARDE